MPRRVRVGVHTLKRSFNSFQDFLYSIRKYGARVRGAGERAGPEVSSCCGGCRLRMALVPRTSTGYSSEIRLDAGLQEIEGGVGSGAGSGVGRSDFLTFLGRVSMT